MITCELCEGRGWYDAFLNRGGRCELDSVQCHRCKGSGSVSAEVAERLAQGRRLREDRISRGLTVRQEAARLGITAVALGEIERGG